MESVIIKMLQFLKKFNEIVMVCCGMKHMTDVADDLMLSSYSLKSGGVKKSLFAGEL